MTMTAAQRSRILTTYAKSRKGLAYGIRNPDYTLKGYHRGADYRKVQNGGSVITDVTAIDGGKVVFVGGPVGSDHPRYMVGPIVVVDTGRVGAKDRYESHSHTIASVKVGDRVESGDKLGRNARKELAGFVTGVHDHITFTDILEGAWLYSADTNPQIRIDAALKRAQTPEEEQVDITAITISGTKQVFEAGKPREYLRINKDNDASFVSGPKVVVGGVLYLNTTAAGGPFDTKGFPASVQVEQVLDTVDAAGKTTASTSLGVHEVIVSAGLTLSKVPIDPVTVGSGKRLRFKVSVHGIDKLTVNSGRLRYSSTSAGK